jgi:D-alanine--D-alanine ligase
MSRAAIVAVLFGGPSDENGVSINSGRSLADHCDGFGVEQRFIYVSPSLRFYLASRQMLYQNTPKDFDFRLVEEPAYQALELDRRQLRETLAACDVVFPAGHGEFFEDCQLQQILDEWGIPYIGTGSRECEVASDKSRVLEVVRRSGLGAVPSLVIEASDLAHGGRVEKAVKRLAESHKTQRLVAKPAASGSSIGVRRCRTSRACVKHACTLAIDGHRRVLVQPDLKAAGHCEFSLLILERSDGLIVPLAPTEIRCRNVFTYRKKYLPTDKVRLITPAEFDGDVLGTIRDQARTLFRELGLHDFARFDGWVSPTGEILWSDVNLITGLEQNSFLFQQAAHIGWTHSEVLRYLLEQNFARRGASFPTLDRASLATRPRTYVLFGGDTSERQVSVTSGTNVWLKLSDSTEADARPALLYRDTPLDEIGAKPGGWRVFLPPYAYCLHHTVEEIRDACLSHAANEMRLGGLRTVIRNELGASSYSAEMPGAVEPLELDVFLDQCRDEGSTVFLATHGGDGENGVIQGMLARRRIAFTGPGAAASAVCMNKAATNELIDRLGDAGLRTAPRRILAATALQGRSRKSLTKLWREATGELCSSTLIIKPVDDGCSTGVARLDSARDFCRYLSRALSGRREIPPKTLTHYRDATISLSTPPAAFYLLEQCVETASITLEPDSEAGGDGSPLRWDRSNPWIEVTIGAVEEHAGMRVLNPTVTVRRGATLMLEEKFQSGTGVNITPPPAKYVEPGAVKAARDGIERLIAALDLQGLVRIDAFMHTVTGELTIIEVNTIPGMTPATAIFHQGLAEQPPLYPRDLLERVIRAARNRYCRGC